MSIFDLLFLVALLVCSATVIAVAIAGIRGQAGRAFRMLRNLGISTVVYLATAIIVSRVLPLRVLNIGDAQCSDDWCIAVESVKRPPADGGWIYYDVILRISSTARRVA